VVVWNHQGVFQIGGEGGFGTILLTPKDTTGFLNSTFDVGKKQ